MHRLDLSKIGVKIRGVLHVGAHRCEESGGYARDFGAGIPVVWIEAIPELALVNRARGHRVLNVAADDSAAQSVTFNITSDLQSSSLMPFTPDPRRPGVTLAKTITVKTDRLDSVLSRESIDLTTMNFLRVSVAGTELRVLRGLGKLLPAHFDLVSVRASGDPAAVVNYLKEAGFRESPQSSVKGAAEIVFQKAPKDPTEENIQWIDTTEDGGNVYVETVGGLGNQLFQMAAGLAYAWRENRRAVFARSWSSPSVFAPRTSHWHTLFCELPQLGAREWTKAVANASVHQDYDTGFRAIPSFSGGKQVLIKGYFQHRNHFDGQLERLVRVLFPSPIVQYARSLLDDQLDSNQKTKRWAFLHVRRGDYLKLSHTHPVLHPSFYQAAARHFDASVRFIVFCEESDLPVVRKEFLALPDLAPRIGAWVDHRIPDYLQLLMMAQCNAGGILANSTFSCWGAYAGSCLCASDQPKYVAPTLWFTQAKMNAEIAGICLPSWIRCDPPLQYNFASMTKPATVACAPSLHFDAKARPLPNLAPVSGPKSIDERAAALNAPAENVGGKSPLTGKNIAGDTKTQAQRGKTEMQAPAKIPKINEANEASMKSAALGETNDRKQMTAADVQPKEMDARVATGWRPRGMLCCTSGGMLHVRNKEGMESGCKRYQVAWKLVPTEQDAVEALQAKDGTQWDIVWFPCALPARPADFRNRRLLLGPHHFVFPKGDLKIAPKGESQGANEAERYENAAFMALSAWNAEVYREFGGLRTPLILTAPFGLDTDLFRPTLDPIKRRASTKILIYFKNRRESDLAAARDAVFRRFPKAQVRTFRYGSYDRDQYRRTLDECRFGVWVGGHESQGFALQEALSMDVPLLVWNVESMFDEVNMQKGTAVYRREDPELKGKKLLATSAPYWDDRCGVVFRRPDQIDKALDDLIQREPTLKPRQFAIEQLSVDVCTRRLFDLLAPPRS